MSLPFASGDLRPLLLSFALFGCGAQVVFDGESTGDGGNGGGGNGQGGAVTTLSGPTTTTNTTTTTNVVTSTNVATTSVTTGVGGSSGCDTGEFNTSDSQVCADCVDCSIGSICSNEYDAFINAPGSNDWINCVFGDGSPQNPGCQDDACIQMCNGAYPGVYEVYVGLIQCVFCASCYNNCDGPTNCMMGF